MHKNLKRGLARGALDPESKTWPGISELSLLRIIGLIWPTSDFNHAVVSPTRVLMGAYLGLGRVRSLGDIASGLFLCTLFLQFETLSKRLVPEAVNFLVNTVLHLSPHPYREASDLPGSFPSPDFRSDLCTPLSMNTQARRRSPVVRKAELSGLVTANDDDEQAKSDLLLLALLLLGQFADLYKAIDGFIESYEPVLAVLENLETKKLCDDHKVGNLSFLVLLIPHLRFFLFLRHNYPNLSILSSDYSNSRIKQGDPCVYRRISPYRFLLISPNSRPRIQITCADRIPITRRTKPRSCGTSISRRRRVPSGSSGKTPASLLVSSRRSRLRRIAHIMNVCVACLGPLKVSERKKRRWKERKLRIRGGRGESNVKLVIGSVL